MRLVVAKAIQNKRLMQSDQWNAFLHLHSLSLSLCHHFYSFQLYVCM